VLGHGFDSSEFWSMDRGGSAGSWVRFLKVFGQWGKVVVLGVGSIGL
jgi:hypothetical protein